MSLRLTLVMVMVLGGGLVSSALGANISGGPTDDTIRGTPGPDLILGRGGNDLLRGRGGNDVLSGGRGRDTLLCGAGTDAAIADREDRVDPQCEVIVRQGTGATDALAQPEDEADEPEENASGDDGDGLSEQIFPWLDLEGGDTDWFDGVMRFVLGMFGALVTVFYLLGGFLPSMGGKVEYEEKRLDLEAEKTSRLALISERKQLADKDPVPEARLAALERLSADREARIVGLEQDLAKERRHLFLIGFPLYVILGGFFAAAVAQSLAQALLIGFGWTAAADRLGLKRQLEVSQRARDENVQVLKDNALQAQQLGSDVAQLRRELDVKDKTMEGALKTIADLRTRATQTTGERQEPTPPQSREGG